MTPARAERRLIFFGILLLIFGIFTGLFVGMTKNRMLLSAHLEGVLNGMLLIAVGAVFRKLTLGETGQKWLVRTLVFSGYLNWAATLLAAILKTNEMTPIAGVGGAPQWAEKLVSTLLVILVLDTFVALGILAKGAFGDPPAEGAAGQKAA